MDQTIYLDNSASSRPKPEAIYQFMDRFVPAFGVNPGRAGYRLCRETGELVDRARGEVAAFLGALTAPRRDGPTGPQKLPVVISLAGLLHSIPVETA